MKIANNRRSVITKLGIGCVVCLLLGFGILLYAQEKTKSEFISTKPQMDAAKINKIDTPKMQAMAKAEERPAPQRNNRSWGREDWGRGGVDSGENAAFYKTIIDHNLFRPLGWTPPKNEPSYSLIGAKVVDPNDGISEATLLERRSNRYYFVTIGTKVGDMTVKDIQEEKVTLDKAGETITLRQNWELQLLTTTRGSRGNSGGDRGEGGSERASNNNAGQNRGNQMNAQRRQPERASAQQRMRGEWMERMRNASGEERREMIERFRRSRGGSRRGRGRD